MFAKSMFTLQKAVFLRISPMFESRYQFQLWSSHANNGGFSKACIRSTIRLQNLWTPSHALENPPQRIRAMLHSRNQDCNQTIMLRGTGPARLTLSIFLFLQKSTHRFVRRANIFLANRLVGGTGIGD